MANSVDPDQTALLSGSALFAYAILSVEYKILGQLHVPHTSLNNLSFYNEKKKNNNNKINTIKGSQIFRGTES